MPGKPSRRVRKRQGGNTERRPRPAPAVSSQRIVRTPRREAAGATEVERPDAQILPEATAASASLPANAAAREETPRAGVANPLRRGATTSARAMEAQREERIRRESLGDLKRIAIAAGVTVVALGLAAAVL